MVTFRNNNNTNRRGSFRRNERNFKTNGDRQKFGSNFTNNENFKRKAPGRNNHNAPKLIDKYNDLAREALSNGDKILSENYLQHADHFTRVLNERESLRKEKTLFNKSENNENAISDHAGVGASGDITESRNDIKENSQDSVEVKKSAKSQPEIN
jgi:hypothetical protein